MQSIIFGHCSYCAIDNQVSLKVLATLRYFETLYKLYNMHSVIDPLAQNPRILKFLNSQIFDSNNNIIIMGFKLVFF